MMKKRNIEAWEAALIKAMLEMDTFTRDQIIAYFTRPERTVNPARINEIGKGTIHADVAPAVPAQVEVYLRSFRSPQEAQKRFFEQDPVHPVNLDMLFGVKDGTTDILRVDETAQVECKESLNFGQKADYARVIASFANARGGFLVFGIRNQDKRITGIDSSKLASYDSAKLNQYLSERFAPVPVWQKTERVIAGKTVGFLFTHQASQKPLICLKNDGVALKEADIYYRYPGETRRIKHGELVQLLGEQARTTERQWADVLRRVENAGVENVAILDTVTGEVSGRSGRFLIDEKLIPKLKFVAEGHFSETEGDPTLKLIGDVEALSVNLVPESQTVIKKVHLTDFDLMDDFVKRNRVEDPPMYIRHLAYSSKIWLPVYYYMRQAGLDELAGLEVIRREKNAKHKHVSDLTKRIANRTRPTGAPSVASFTYEREALRTKEAKAPTEQDACKRLVKAVRTLKAGEIDSGYLLPLLSTCFDKFNEGKLAIDIQYALAHVDVVWHMQVLGSAKGAKVPSAA